MSIMRALGGSESLSTSRTDIIFLSDNIFSSDKIMSSTPIKPQADHVPSVQDSMPQNGPSSMSSSSFNAQIHAMTNFARTWVFKLTMQLKPGPGTFPISAGQPTN
jgi:hypothetical protein